MSNFKRLFLSKTKGFTLIELLVVIVIIALLMAIAIPAYLNQQKKAKDAKAKVYLNTAYRSARGALLDNNGSYPAAVTLSNLIAGDQPQFSIRSGSQASATTPGQIVIDSATGGSTSSILMYVASDSGSVFKLNASKSGAPILTDLGVPAAVNAYATAVLASSPLLYWRLNESAGPTAADASGNSKTGTYAGAGVSYSQAGALTTGPAQTSISGTAVAGGVSRAYEAPLNPAAWTLEAWVYVTGGAGTRRVIMTNLNATDGEQLEIDTNNRFNCRIGTGGSTTNNTDFTQFVSLNTWYHVACASSNQILYVNGANVASTGSTNSTVNTAASFYVGRDGSGQWFPGSIDEAALYGTSLSGATISNHYAAR